MGIEALIENDDKDAKNVCNTCETEGEPMMNGDYRCTNGDCEVLWWAPSHYQG